MRVFDLNGKPVEFSTGGNGWGFYHFVKKNGAFARPEGIGVDDDGNVYISDNQITTMWIQKFTAEGSWLTGWGMYQEGDTYNGIPLFKSLAGLDVSGSGDNVRVIAADPANDRLREFNADGLPISKRDSLGVLGSHGVAWWRFKEPWDVATGANGSVYVADRLNNRVERYNSAGVLDKKTPGEIPPPAKIDNGYFKEPAAIDYDPVSGFVFVAEAGDNHRVQRLDADLAYEGHKWGSKGTAHGQFQKPQGIAVGPSPTGGRWVYVSDTENNRVEVFDLDGTYKATMGTGSLLAPAGLVVTNEGVVYVVDSGHRKVTRFVPGNSTWTAWTASTSFGISGTGDAVLSQPWGLSMDDAGYLYVADAGAHKIKKYSTAGVFDTVMGNQGSSVGELNMPRGVAVSDAGVVYVADTVNDRFQAFVRPVEITISYPDDLAAYNGPVTPSFSVGEGWVSKGADLDGTPWDGESITSEGVHVFRVWATDAHGLTHEKVVQFIIDRTAPTTLGGAAETYENSALIALSPFDGLSGLYRTRWILDGGPMQQGTTIATAQRGDHTLEFWSIDLAGNEEFPHHFASFTINDTIAPTTSSNVLSTYADKATITLSPSDASSGVVSTEYRLDGGAPVAGTSLSVSALGNHVLQFRSVDGAGNTENWKSVAFSVKKGTVLTASRSKSPVAYGGTATVKATLKSSSGTLLPGRQLKLYRSKDGDNWAYVKSITSSTGSYSYSTPLVSLAYFKWEYDAGDELEMSDVDEIGINANASLYEPIAPKTTYANWNVSVYGAIKPRHQSGAQCVIIKAYRYESGKYVYKKSTILPVKDRYSYSRYYGNITFPKAGRWRIRAFHDDADHYATYSTYDYIDVK